MRFNTAFDIPADLSFRSGKSFSLPSLTDQSFTLNADLNALLKRYGQGAVLPQNYVMPTYQDFSDSPDSLQSALDAVRVARDDFENLPFHVRAEFGHSPFNFVKFSQSNDPRDLALGRKLGLLPSLPASPAPAALSPSNSSSAVPPPA